MPAILPYALSSRLAGSPVFLLFSVCSSGMAESSSYHLYHTYVNYQTIAPQARVRRFGRKPKTCRVRRRPSPTTKLNMDTTTHIFVVHIYTRNTLVIYTRWLICDGFIYPQSVRTHKTETYNTGRALFEPLLYGKM